MTPNIMILESPSIRASLKHEHKDFPYLIVESGLQLTTLLLDEIVMCVDAPEGENFNNMMDAEIKMTIENIVKAKLTS